MDEIAVRRQKLRQAISTMQKVLDKFKDTYDENDYDFFRDSAIKRFEYCYDLLWKCFKDTLEHDHGVIVAGPKNVFREIERLGLVSKQELALLIDMVDDRNLTSHTYNEGTAKEIFASLSGYHELMQQLATRISKE